MKLIFSNGEELSGLLNWTLHFRCTFRSLDLRALGANVLYQNDHQRAVNQKRIPSSL